MIQTVGSHLRRVRRVAAAARAGHWWLGTQRKLLLQVSGSASGLTLPMGCFPVLCGGSGRSTPGPGQSMQQCPDNPPGLAKWSGITVSRFFTSAASRCFWRAGSPGACLCGFLLEALGSRQFQGVCVCVCVAVSATG